jgi:hypothetical protein
MLICMAYTRRVEIVMMLTSSPPSLSDTLHAHFETKQGCAVVTVSVKHQR